jgi:hypothetical protein
VYLLDGGVKSIRGASVSRGGEVDAVLDDATGSDEGSQQQITIDCAEGIIARSEEAVEICERTEDRVVFKYGGTS